MRDSLLFSESDGGSSGRADSTVPDTAASKLSDTWQVLRLREQLLGDSWPFNLAEDALTRRPGRKLLRQTAAYTSMLLIEAASLKWYKRLAIQPGDAIREWFEHLAVVAIGRFSSGAISRFGAPFPKGWPKSFAGRVQRLASIFQVDARLTDLAKHASREQQDDSLDVVARLKFLDEKGGAAYLLVQCATGANWAHDKPGQPNIMLWKSYVAWDGPTIKALAVPFTLRAAGELQTASIRHWDAVVFDRLRLAGAIPDDLIDEELRGKLESWCRTKLLSLQERSATGNSKTARVRRSRAASKQ